MMGDPVADLADAIDAMLRCLRPPPAGVEVRLVDEREIEVATTDGAIRIRPGELASESGGEIAVEKVDRPRDLFEAAAVVLDGDFRRVGSAGDAPVYEVLPRRWSQTAAAIFSPGGVFVRWGPGEGREPVSGSVCFGNVAESLGPHASFFDLRGTAALVVGDSDIAIVSSMLCRDYVVPGGGGHLHEYSIAISRCPLSAKIVPSGVLELPTSENVDVTLELRSDVVDVHVKIGENLASFSARSATGSAIGAWYPGREGAVVLSPGGRGDAGLQHFPALPVWDELVDVLGAEESTIVVARRVGEGLLIVRRDGRVEGSPPPRSTTAFDVVVADPGDVRASPRLDVDSLPSAIADSEFFVEGSPPLFPEEGVVVAVDAETGDSAWVSRFGELSVGYAWCADFGKAAFAIARGVADVAAELYDEIFLPRRFGWGGSPAIAALVAYACEVSVG